jgi:tetratricopeptide (TPR) repeat protein/mono/diheme cytochrome c family protein
MTTPTVAAAIRPALLVLLAGAIVAARGAPSAGALPVSEPVTFNMDIAPIVFERCAPCHRPGESGPFPLLSYDDVRRRARLVAQVTAARIMPPWAPEPGYGEFAGERRLSDADIAAIQRWVRDGAPEGEARDRPHAPVWSEGWQPGTPDLIVAMPEPLTVPAGGTDLFRKVVLPMDSSGTHYVRAMEFRPGNPRVVHHAIVRLDPTGTARSLVRSDEADDSGMIFTEGESPAGHFLGWSPGGTPSPGHDDLAWRLDPGTDLILQLHLVPTGRPEAVRAEVGFFFAERPPSRIGLGLQLGSYVIDIPPGEAQYTVEDRYVLPVDVEVHAIYPHAHYLGKDVQAWAALPDGTKRWLIWIKDWNFDWQGEYRYAQPLELPRGSTLFMKFTYDNSIDNPRNPNHPPQRVLYGGRSSDEMGNLWLQVVPRAAAELPLLQEDAARKGAAREIAGYLKMLEERPAHAGVHRALGFAYLRAGSPREALAHLGESLRQGPEEPLVRYTLGNLEAGRGNTREAIAHFRRAVEIGPGFAEAHNNLGVMLQTEGQFDEAARLYRRAIELKPDHAEAHNNLGVMLQAGGELDEAIEHFREALRLNPDYTLARENLADALRAREKR